MLPFPILPLPFRSPLPRRGENGFSPRSALKSKWLIAGSGVLFSVLLSACTLPTGVQATPTLIPTIETPTIEPSATATASPIPPTSTATLEPSLTPTDTPTSTDTPTVTLTPSNTNTYTATSTASNTSTASATYTFTPSDTLTFTPSDTATNTYTPSLTFTLTDTSTNTYTPTLTPTDTATETYTPSNTFTPSQTATDTPTITNTPSITLTPTDTATLTFTPSNTFTPSLTATSTATITLTPSNTLIPTETLTQTATITNTLEDTATGTSTPIPPSDTPLPPSATASETTTYTAIPDTATPEVVASLTPLPTITLTPSWTFTPSLTPPRPTATVTPIPTRANAVTATRRPTLIIPPTRIAALPSAAPNGDAPRPITATPFPTFARLTELPTLLPTDLAQPTITLPPVTVLPYAVTLGAVPGSGTAAVAVIATSVIEGIPPDFAVPIATAQPDLSGLLTTTNGTIQFPILTNGAIELDFDISATGRRASILVDANGIPRLFIDGQPFNVTDKHNKQRFVQVRWSPDGRYLAYIVQTQGWENIPIENNQRFFATIDDGVWLYDTQDPNAGVKHLLRNQYVRPANDFRIARALNWAVDSQALLVTLEFNTGEANIRLELTASADFPLGPFYSDILPYRHATWTPSRRSFIAVKFDGALIRVERVGDGYPSRDILTATQTGLNMLYPAESLTENAIYFLANIGAPPVIPNPPNADNLTLFRYDKETGIWAAVGLPIFGTVLSAEWSPDRTAVLLQLSINGLPQTAILRTDGSIEYVIPTVGGSGAHWRR